MKKNGFSLIELMVVIMIMGLLTTLVVVNIRSAPDEAKVEIAKSQIRAFEDALHRFRMDNGFYPDTEQGLEALVKKPETGRQPNNWRSGGYLDRNIVPDDPWGNPYIYISPGMHRSDFVDIYSYGANGREGGEGVNAEIRNWEF
jgi:general secretion pathway protein G